MESFRKKKHSRIFLVRTIPLNGTTKGGDGLFVVVHHMGSVQESKSSD